MAMPRAGNHDAGLAGCDKGRGDVLCLAADFCISSDVVILPTEQSLPDGQHHFESFFL